MRIIEGVTLVNGEIPVPALKEGETLLIQPNGDGTYTIFIYNKKGK